MMMKKKFVAVTVAASILFGGTAGAAGAALFQKFGEDLKKEYSSEMAESILRMDRSRTGERAYTVEVANQEERIKATTKAYLQKRTDLAAEKASEEDQKHVQEIKKIANLKIVEINKFIDKTFTDAGY